MKVLLRLHKMDLLQAGKFEFRAKHAIRYLDSITPQIKLDGILDVGLMVENSIK